MIAIYETEGKEIAVYFNETEEKEFRKTKKKTHGNDWNKRSMAWSECGNIKYFYYSTCSTGRLCM